MIYDDFIKGLASQVNDEQNMAGWNEAARYMFNFYQVFVRVGFSEEQALSIVIAFVLQGMRSRE